MNIWIPLIGVLVGGLLGLSSTIVVKIFESRRERRALALAFAGEIGAVLEVIKERNYQRNIAQYIAQAETQKGSVVTMHIRVGQKYFTVYDSNAAKLGLLPRHTARKVACFYTFGKSLIEDLTNEEPMFTEPEPALEHLRSIQHMMKRFVDLGTEAVGDLERA